MVANGSVGVLEFYNKAFHSWSDAMSSWTKTAEGIGETFKSNNGSFKWWGNWSEAGKNFAEIMEGLPLPYEPMKNMNETLCKNIRSYREISDNCMKNMVNIVREGYRVDAKIIAGEEPETDAFFEALNCAYDDIFCKMADTLKETPFKGVKDINESLKKSLEAFSDERNTAKSVFKEMMRFNAKMAKLSLSAIKEASNSLNDVKEKGTVSLESQKDIIEACGETLKRTMDILGFLPPGLAPECKDTLDNGLCVAAKNLDVVSAWLEINLRSSQAVARSGDNIRKFTEDMFKEFKKGEMPPHQEIYKKWSKTFEETMNTLIEGVHFNGSIPKFIDVCTDCVKSANEHYRNIASLPYAVKEEMRATVAAEEAGSLDT
jgi:hypothetical protein